MNSAIRSVFVELGASQFPAFARHATPRDMVGRWQMVDLKVLVDDREHASVRWGLFAERQRWCGGHSAKGGPRSHRPGVCIR